MFICCEFTRRIGIANILHLPGVISVLDSIEVLFLKDVSGDQHTASIMYICLTADPLLLGVCGGRRAKRLNFPPQLVIILRSCKI